MKKLVLIFVFSLFGYMSAHAQTQYETGMQKAFDLRTNGQSMEDVSFPKSKNSGTLKILHNA